MERTRFAAFGKALDFSEGAGAAGGLLPEFEPESEPESELDSFLAATGGSGGSTMLVA